MPAITKAIIKQMAKRNCTKAEPALLLAKHYNLAKIPREREKKKKPTTKAT